MPKFLENRWCGVQWTKWIPFESPDISTLPTDPGVYRVKAIGIDELFYIGQTGRNLQERLLALIQNTLQDPEHMPYNDPHTAAPSLWAWKDAEGYSYECSVAPVPSNISTEKREAFESSLLWRYRLQAGTSTRCNHGRFHPRYIKSGNQRDGRRGRRLRDDEENRPQWGPSYPALPSHNRPQDQDWMTLKWTQLQPFEQPVIHHVPSIPGVCKLLDQNNRLVLIEFDQNIHTTLMQLSWRRWKSSPLLFSIATFAHDIPSYQLREIKNDLISGYYDLTRNPPFEQQRFN